MKHPTVALAVALARTGLASTTCNDIRKGGEVPTLEWMGTTLAIAWCSRGTAS